jgi:large subunit ribosomal protein L13
MSNPKTYSAKPADVKREWYVIDASSAPLGRIATTIATYLTGKNKPMYTAHIDCGDNVVVINAAKLIVTGNKSADKIYYKYSGFPGGMKQMTLEQKLAKNPASIIEAAVKGMLPKNKLQADRMKRLRVYNDEAHQQSAQQPKEIKIATAKGDK